MTLKGHNALWHANRTVLWLNGSRRRSAMVSSDRALATCYKLSITMSIFAAVWPQFSMKGFKL